MRPCALHRSLQMPNKCACGCGQRVAFAGCYRKGHQPLGTPCDRAGKHKAHNDINNPINNPINGPINNKRVQEAARVENEERITKMCKDEPYITEAMACSIAETLSTSPLPIFKGLTLEELLQLASDLGQSEADAYAFYFGYTGRQIVVEYLRFLTERGASQQDEHGTFIDPSARNRPVLLWAHDSVITQKEADMHLGFKYIELYTSTIKLNARRVEAAFQKRFQHLPLGTRLWRAPDKGAKYDQPEDAGKVHKVFLTYSPLVAKAWRDLWIKLNP
jgi:hypothetical protein